MSRRVHLQEPTSTLPYSACGVLDRFQRLTADPRAITCRTCRAIYARKLGKFEKRAAGVLAPDERIEPMAFRRNRSRNPEPDAPERFDLGAIRAERARGEADAVAREFAAVPPVVAHFMATPAATPTTPDPLARYLDTLHVRLLGGLPPVDLAARYDEGLAAALADAQQCHGDASRLAGAWRASEPGSAAFTAALDDADDEAAIVEVLTSWPPRAFARALLAQRRALEADNAARAYAAGATHLHDDLDAYADRLAGEVGALFERARDERSRRFYDDGLERAAVWREVVALYRWCKAPTNAFRPLDASKIPAEVEWRQYEATERLGVLAWNHVEVPIDAPDAPKPPTRNVLGLPPRGMLGA